MVPEWQTAASGVLVALGCRFCNEVMADLQEKFQPGVLPHFFVVQTMANLAMANGGQIYTLRCVTLPGVHRGIEWLVTDVAVYGMVPFLKVVMGTMLPMLGIAKQDNMRWVFSTGWLCQSSHLTQLQYIKN